jgi:hypothetical protein
VGNIQTLLTNLTGLGVVVNGTGQCLMTCFRIDGVGLCRCNISIYMPSNDTSVFTLGLHK